MELLYYIFRDLLQHVFQDKDFSQWKLLCFKVNSEGFLLDLSIQFLTGNSTQTNTYDCGVFMCMVRSNFLIFMYLFYFFDYISLQDLKH